jgi:hypothetical protein
MQNRQTSVTFITYRISATLHFWKLECGILFLIWKLLPIKIVNPIFNFLHNKLNFCCGNYLREETINYKEVLTAETIQRRKLFKGGNYMRKYGT